MIRDARPADLPAITHVRTSVRENHMSVEEMASRGITHATIAAGMHAGYYGTWVAEAAGDIVAFSIADSRDGSVFALFVLPGCEGRGYGTFLLERCEKFLAKSGYAEAWLTTGLNTKAERFYFRRGWLAAGPDRDDPLSMILRKRL
ncbi:hypothetical protein BH10PSE7_BH10PSE7_32600 [soil metagenome]